MLCCKSKPFYNDIQVYSILKYNLIFLIIIQLRVNVFFNGCLLSLLPHKADVSFCLFFIISVKSICCCLVVKSSLTVLQLRGPQTARLLCLWVHARILEWVSMPSSRGSSPPRDQTCISCIAGGFFITEPWGKANKVYILL